MTRKPLLVKLGLVLLLLGSLTTALLLLLRHERTFYQRVAPPPGRQRETSSQEFQAHCIRLFTEIDEKEPEWEERFTQDQINSYFEEDFKRTGLDKQLLPPEISEPRIAIENDRLRFGFRYGEKPWSTVVTMDLRVWLPANKPNVIAIEVESLHAGGVPISAHSILKKAFEVVEKHNNNTELNWYRYNNHPVALLNLQVDPQQRQAVQLYRLAVEDGQLIIGGRSVDGGGLRAMLMSRVVEGLGNSGAGPVLVRGE